MAAGDKKKYKIQLIKAGIGDPLICVAFKFLADPNYDNPEEYPVENLDIFSSLEYLTAPRTYSQKSSGNIQMATFHTLNSYYLTFPFDQPEDYTPGNEIYGVIQASGTDNNGTAYTIDFEGSTLSGGVIQLPLEYDATPISFATLNTRYTYCPNGDCINLGTE